MSFPLPLGPFTRKHLSRRLQQAYASGTLRLVQRLHALLAFAEDRRVQEGAAMLGLGEQTVRDYRNRFLWKPLASLPYKRSPGRPSKVTNAQRRELANVLKAGPQAAGDTSGCWNTAMIQALSQNRFGGSYHPPYLATLLHKLGFSSQKAPFVADHLNTAKRLEWCRGKWPRIVRYARQRKALLLFGADASVAQWGSLSSPWAPTGEQPEVPTSGKRKGDKVLGRIDYFSGQFFYKTPEGRFNSESSAAFLRDVLAQTQRPVVVSQDGARSHTSQAMHQFFNAHAARVTIEQLPAYSPEFTPLEPLWQKGKKAATPLKYFPVFTHLQAEVDRALLHFAHTPREIMVLMARYCETLGAMAA